MPIDGCHVSFEKLAQTVLPQHFSRLQEAMRTPLAAERLVGFKTVTRKVLERTGKKCDVAARFKTQASQRWLPNLSLSASK
jgi:hypothetical protein